VNHILQYIIHKPVNSISPPFRFDEYPGLFTATPPKAGDMCGKTNPQYSQWSPSRTDKPSFHQPQDFGRMVFSAEGVR